jgi:hypothetical protein
MTKRVTKGSEPESHTRSRALGSLTSSTEFFDIVQPHPAWHVLSSFASQGQQNPAFLCLAIQGVSLGFYNRLPAGL